MEEFFKTDPDWLELQKKVRHLDTGDAILPRSEFIKLVGWKKYSPEAYKEYVAAMQKKQKPSNFNF